MENLLNSTAPKVEYLFAASKEILLTNYWEIMEVLNNLSENDFGSVHYALNDYHPGLISYYIEKAKVHLNLTHDNSGIPSENVHKKSQLYLARLYSLKTHDVLKHYIEIEYSKETQLAINNFVGLLGTTTCKKLAQHSKQIIPILSKISFANFCRSLTNLDNHLGLSVHYVMDSVYNCYSNSPNNFNDDNIDLLYSNEIFKRRLLLLKENDLLNKLFPLVRKNLICEFLSVDTEEKEISIFDTNAYKQKQFNEMKIESILKLHIQSELDIFMSFENRSQDLIEDINKVIVVLTNQYNEQE